MALKFSTELRNARADAIETVGGASAIMRIYTGAPPANVAAARTGTVVATINLPADWMANASGGAKAKAGTWQDSSADADGQAGYFTVFKADGTTGVMQGTVGKASATPDMVVDNDQFAAGQDFTVTGFNINEGNA